MIWSQLTDKQRKMILGWRKGISYYQGRQSGKTTAWRYFLEHHEPAADEC